MEGKNYYSNRADFKEDMRRKKHWFQEQRGIASREDFDEKIQKAVAHIKEARKVKGKPVDPLKGKLDKDIKYLGKVKGLSLKKVEVPKKKDSENFVSHGIAVSSDSKFLKGSIVFKPMRGKKKDYNLPTAKVFYFDEKQRQWNIIDDSGYNAKDNYFFCNVFRPGVYAAIALPSDKEQLRKIALSRFAFLNIKFGQDVGIVDRASDYFDKKVFDQLCKQAVSPDLSVKDRNAYIKASKKVHVESLKLKKEWPDQFAFNGQPEWHLLEDMQDNSPQFILDLELQDILDLLPLLTRLSNRVGRWHSLGPNNINGRVKSLVIHPTNGNILYAGAANGGIWKTTNGGDSWRHLWKFESTMAVGSLAISKSSPGTLYAATGEYTPGYGPSYSGKGIYKSTNSGDSWTNIAPEGDVGSLCSKIDIHPTNPNIVYVATNSGVYKTTNGGSHWDKVLNGGASDLVLDPDTPETLYAGIRNDGLYKTTNGGDDWDKITDDNVIIPIISWLFPHIRGDFPQDNDAGWIKIAMGKNGVGGTGFLAVKLGQRGERILTSGNGGDTWFPLPGTEEVRYNEWCTLIAVHPNDHKCIYAGGVGLDYTFDGYNFSNTSGTWADHHVMVFHPTNDDICYVCCDAGVYRSEDKGRTYTLKSRYLKAAQLMSLGVADTGTFVAGCATQDQGIIQTEGSPEWDNFGGGNEWGMFVVDPNDSENIFISPGSGALRRSTNRGRNFTTLQNGLRDFWVEEDRDTKLASFRHVAVRPGNSNIVIGVATLSDEEKDDDGNVTNTYPTQRRIYITITQGDNWATAFDLESDRGTFVAFAPSDGNRVYVATEGGHIHRSNTSGLLGWSKPYADADRPPAGIIRSITVEHSDPDTLYITYGNIYPNVYRSENGGETWEPVSGDHSTLTLPDISMNSLVIDHEDSDVLYVGSDVGVFRSNDAGYSWYFYNDSVDEYDLPIVLVTSLGMHKSTNRLFASTMGRGLYYTFTSGLVNLRITEISHYFRGFRFRGIQRVKVTDGSQNWIMTRNEVINRIEAGSNFYTIGSDGSRAEVIVMRPDAQHPLDYIKTTPDHTLADNLLSLPEFYSY
ncbi:DUF3892 domain-containing protein [Aureisphaera galaxeae]|uniref:DUF3892 domain-containing protein n=1 Tax=Aureisphaera galaxeae TaxID=1538023 RepID=UPI0023506475|nr:DUF3892 domain-containing protein [Aureisphaera galaxeae]MDC8005869.1 DUF3892 domain-containing protein [Aureisphaera galaxeae]